ALDGHLSDGIAHRGGLLHLQALVAYHLRTVGERGQGGVRHRGERPVLRVLAQVERGYRLDPAEGSWHIRTGALALKRLIASSGQDGEVLPVHHLVDHLTDGNVEPVLVGPSILEIFLVQGQDAAVALIGYPEALRTVKVVAEDAMLPDLH